MGIVAIGRRDAAGVMARLPAAQKAESAGQIVTLGEVVLDGGLGEHLGVQGARVDDGGRQRIERVRQVRRRVAGGGAQR